MLEYYQGAVYSNVAHGPETPVWDTARIPLSELEDDDPDWADEFHVWRMDWDEDSIELYLDDELVNEFDVDEATRPDGYNPFREEMYLLLNLAVGGLNGGDPSGTDFPGTFEVDYVRVYQ
jgi:beta-glucanase (GH16 family)